MAREFLCGAEKLIELIADIYGRHKWMNADLAVKIHSEFLVLVERVYKEDALELAISALSNQYRWANVGKIVFFGKQNDIRKDDWIIALGGQAARLFPR